MSRRRRSSPILVAVLAMTAGVGLALALLRILISWPSPIPPAREPAPLITEPAPPPIVEPAPPVAQPTEPAAPDVTVPAIPDREPEPPPELVTPGPPPPVPRSARRGIGAFQRRIEAALAAEPVPTEPLTGPLAFEIYDLVWAAPGPRPFARADAVIGVLDLGAAFQGDVIVEPLELRRPDVIVERRAGETQWNVERAIDRLLAELAGEPVKDRDGDVDDALVEFRRVTIIAGRVAVRAPDQRFTFEGVQATLARATLADPAAPAPDVVATELATTLIVPEEALALPVTVAGARLLFPDGVVDFDIDRATIRESVLAGAQGTWRPGAAGLGMDAALRALPLVFADVQFLLPELPPEGVARFDLRIAPLPGGRTALRFRDLVASAPPSEARGALAVVVGGPEGFRLESADLLLNPLEVALLERLTGPLPYGGTLTGRLAGTAAELRLDAVARLTAPELAEPFTVDLEIVAAWPPAGIELLRLTADLEAVPLAALRPLAPGLPLRGSITGRIVVRGLPGVAPLELDVRLALAEGTISLAGTLDLTGPRPAYDLAGMLVAIQLDALFEPPLPPVALTARYALAGQGIDPETAVATFEVVGGFAGWLATPADSLVLRGALEAGRLALDTAVVRLATLNLEAGGLWAFTFPPAGGVSYELAVAELGLWAPYLPLPDESVIAGRLRTAGLLSGTFRYPTVEGTAAGVDLAYDGWAAARADAGYRLVFGAVAQEIDVEATAVDVATPTAGRFATARLDLLQRPPAFAVALEAERVDGGFIDLLADGTILPEGERRATLRRLRLDLDEQRWALARPALVVWGLVPGVLVRDLVLEQVGDEGRIAIDGRIAPALSDLRVQVEAVAIGEVLMLLGEEPVVTGDLWADAMVAGSPEEPTIDARFRLVEGAVQGVELTDFRGTFQYRDLRLEADANAFLDDAPPVELRASLPLELELDLPPRARLLPAGPVDAALVAESLPLDVLERAVPDIRDAEGMLTARAAVTGTVEAPVLEGLIQVRDGAVTLPAVDRRYREITADVVLNGRVAEIQLLRARSDGWADVTGTIVFEELTRPVADLTIALDEFRALGVERRTPAAFWGELRVVGPLAAPTVTGDIRVDEGDVAVPTLARDALLDEDVLVAVEPAPLIDDAPDGPPPEPLLEAVTIDEVRVEAGDDLWFVTEEVRAQLAGDLVISSAADDVTVVGTLEGDRGTFTLRVGPVVRQFDIVESEVRFFGTAPPNPAIEIVAVRRILTADRQILEITARIGGTLDAPTFALTAPGAAPIPESELLSFVLFGQPGFALGDGVVPGQELFEEALLGGLAELATIELEEALLTDVGLPLRFFRFRPFRTPLAGPAEPGLVFGLEVAPDVFLTIESGVIALFGATEAATTAWSAWLEWRIDPQWTLALGFEPVNRGRLFRGLGVGLPIVNPERQFSVEVRRRWTY